MSAIRARAVQRGRLLERINQQRTALAQELAPVASALDAADQIIEGAERTRRWVSENPLIIKATLVALLIWRPKGVIKLAKKGVVGWRTVRFVRRLLI